MAAPKRHSAGCGRDEYLNPPGSAGRFKGCTRGVRPDHLSRGIRPADTPSPAEGRQSLVFARCEELTGPIPVGRVKVIGKLNLRVGVQPSQIRDAYLRTIEQSTFAAYFPSDARVRRRSS